MFPNKYFYLDHDTLYNRPTSRAARRENWGSESLLGQTGGHIFAVPGRKCLINLWKRATGKSYSTCKVQLVVKVQLSWEEEGAENELGGRGGGELVD